MPGRPRIEETRQLAVAELSRVDLDRGTCRVDPEYTTDARTIMIVSTKQAIGGTRYWFLCPDCGSRRTWLAVLPHRVTCRVCARLAYSSQCLSDLNRRARSAEALYDRLNVEYGPMQREQGKKPPGLHWRTYWRLYDKARAIDPWSNAITEHYRHGRGLRHAR